MNKTSKVDILNIGLVLISLWIAFKLPFKLFMFSYAVLGPLHYLTEINWLSERNFFSKAKRSWSIVFVIIAFIISLYPTLKLFGWEKSESIQGMLKLAVSNSNALILAAFLFATVYILLRRGSYLALALLSAIIVSILASTSFPEAFIMIGVFVPTLVHVYIFTLLFIIYGAIKSKSRYGYLLALVVLAVPFLIFYLPVDTSAYTLQGSAYDTFIGTNMYIITSTLETILGISTPHDFDILSNFAVRAQVFIAFAYTYHYVNWFSKTSIIGWGKSLTKKKALWIIGLWALSVGLYMYDYKFGFIALFFLSFLHVLLEFPLNAVTIRELVKGTRHK